MAAHKCDAQTCIDTTEEAALKQQPNHKKGISSRAPIIGEHCFIGAKAIILGDVKIGNYASIGSGAVVLKDVPEGCTAVGVPARIISPFPNQRHLD